ncbi:MAG: hypothetical protein DMG09_26245, partial [Acidobacteria bacterium]
GLYSRRPDAAAARAAILTSVLTTLALQKYVGAHVLGFLNPPVAGIAVSFVVLWGVTLFRARRSKTKPPMNTDEHR